MNKFKLQNSNYKPACNALQSMAGRSIFNDLMFKTLGHWNLIKNLKFKIKNLPYTTRQGFTFLEIIIYMGLLIVILLVVTNLLIASSSFSLEETARLEIQKNGRFATERIIRDLQASQTVSIPNNSTPTDNLVIGLPGQITYNTANDRLVRGDSVSSENVTDNQVKIDHLSFSRIENPGGKTTIKINLTINYIGQVEGNRNISQEFSTTYALK